VALVGVRPVAPLPSMPAALVGVQPVAPLSWMPLALVVPLPSHYDQIGGRVDGRIADWWPILLGPPRKLAIGRSAKFNRTGIDNCPEAE
jgi:hypothetical protein